jgi:hypothetical protein
MLYWEFACGAFVARLLSIRNYRAFTAVMALLVGLLNDSTLVRHYPGPVVVRTVTTKENAPRPPLFALGTKNGWPAIEPSRGVSIAKADAEKSRREKLTQVHKFRVLADQRENYEGRGSAIALGYAEGSGYRPGLDGQR